MLSFAKRLVPGIMAAFKKRFHDAGKEDEKKVLLSLENNFVLFLNAQTISKHLKPLWRFLKEINDHCLWRGVSTSNPRHHFPPNKIVFVQSFLEMYRTAYSDFSDEQLINQFKMDIKSTGLNITCKEIKPRELPLKDIYENIKKSKDENGIYEDAFPTVLKNFV